MTEAPKSELAETQLMLGQAYAMLDQTDRMIEAYSRYIIKVDEIDQHVATNCIVIIRDMVVANESLNTFLNWINEGKKFTKNFIKNLLIAFCQSADNNKRASTKRLADTVKDFWDELDNPLRKALALTYSDIEDWTAAKSLWRELIGDGIQETDELRIYIITLYREYQDFDELSTRLAYWRKHFRPDIRLLGYEVTIYRALKNYAILAEVAACGMEYFPDEDLFWVDRIRALHRLDDTDSLSPLLDERILTTELPPSICMSIAHIYLVRDQVELGKEACHQVLKQNWANPIIKQAYLSLPTTYNIAYDTPSPEIIHEGMVVRLSAEGREYLLELTPDELQYNSIAKQVVGLRLNESFSHKKPLIDERITYSVVNIFDKYIGQCALIYEEIGQKPSAMPFQAFNIPVSEDPTELLDLMKEMIGPQEIERNLLNEDSKKLFANHEIGFFELAQNVFGSDPIRAWEYATSDFGDGFPIFPLILLNKKNSSTLVNEKTEFILDFSSLLTLHYLAEKGLSNLVVKPFVVSQYLIDYVDFELEKTTNEKASKMSLGFRGDQLIPYFHPEDLQERQIRFWLSLQNWISSNCRPDYSWERLGYYQEVDNADSKQFFSDHNIFKSGFLDTLLLVNRPNRLLVSDDIFLYTKSSIKHIDSVTTEWYLSKMHSIQYQETLWLELVRLNMRGIQISGTQLYQTFSSMELATQTSSDYLKAINSFAPRYNPDRNNLLRVVTFLKNLYAENLMLDYKRRISRILFQTALTAPGPIPEQALRLLLDHIDIEFDLLGGYGDIVKEDLYHAIETLT